MDFFIYGFSLSVQDNEPTKHSHFDPDPKILLFPCWVWLVITRRQKKDHQTIKDIGCTLGLSSNMYQFMVQLIKNSRNKDCSSNNVFFFLFDFTSTKNIHISRLT